MLSYTLLGLKTFLAFVFTLSAVAKLSDFRRITTTLSQFGVSRFTALSAGLLCAAEIAAAVLLLTKGFAPQGALAAALLLILFTAVLATNILRHKRVACSCFGRLSDEPVTWSTVFRNLGLITVALVLALYHPPATTPSLLSLTVYGNGGLGGPLQGDLALLPFFVLVSFTIVLAGRVKALQRELAGIRLPFPVAEKLDVGREAPPFRLSSTRGDLVSLDDLLLPGKPVLLVFVLSDCVGCKLLLPTVKQWQQSHAHLVTIAVLAEGDHDEILQEAGQFGLETVLLQGPADEDNYFGEVSFRYGVDLWPSSIVVGPDGLITVGLQEGLPTLAAVAPSLVLERAN